VLVSLPVEDGEIVGMRDARFQVLAYLKSHDRSYNLIIHSIFVCKYATRWKERKAFRAENEGFII
jgi:hypothetical protein